MVDRLLYLSASNAQINSVVTELFAHIWTLYLMASVRSKVNILVLLSAIAFFGSRLLMNTQYITQNKQYRLTHTG